MLFILSILLSFTDMDESKYVLPEDKAIEYVSSQIDNLEIVSYSEMDDGWYFEGYIEGNKVEVFYMDSQDNRIDIYHVAR
tara:strand:+ start:901 stop:1140 length:240 start_codon:yes stop_codon:yes gene_type:complete